MMLDSQARGSKEQIRQLGGMRGLMQKPKKSVSISSGNLIENPIIANFKEGLSILEYFISTHGARKGLADTALKTADAGYLTRRLHDVAQDIIITERDCRTNRGVNIAAIKDGEEVKESLYDRILGRVALYDVKDSISNEILIKAGTLINEDIAEKVEASAVDLVLIRSVLTCESRQGVCSKCYGRNMSSGKIVDVGEAVGTIAAQSIGEPGTQLTLRTFHTGGTAALVATQSNISAKFAGKILFKNIRLISYQDTKDMIDVVVSRNGTIEIIDINSNKAISKFEVAYGSKLNIKDGQTVEKEKILYEWDPYNTSIISEFSGRVHFTDLIVNVTYREANDEQTGHVTRTVVESRDKTKSPAIDILSDSGAVLKSYSIPARAQLRVEDNEEVSIGTSLAKIPRDYGRTRDITGGLPRVTELFEARVPQHTAIVSEIDGYVSHGAPKRGQKTVVITTEDKLDTKEYSIPTGKYVLVQEDDFIKAGGKITDGDINPHDILNIHGPNAVQEYLVNQIQEVYKMQGVAINDKHIEVIVRQMLQKVRVIDAGDSSLIENDNIDKLKLLDENQQLKNMVVIEDKGDTKFNVGGLYLRKQVNTVNKELRSKDKNPAVVRQADPAISMPILLGITQAAITTES
jgi:DNA-directed RNA polymerase subunit beta'